MSALAHVPVMLDEVMDGLALVPGALYVDGTYGGGGYADAALAAGARVEGFDRDPRAVAAAKDKAAKSGGRLVLHVAAFSARAKHVAAGSAQAVQGEANSLRPPSASTAQAGWNCMVHTSGRGSVQAVLATGWLAQADNRTSTAMTQRRRILFSRMGVAE